MIFIVTSLVKLVVYSDKFKLIDPSIARVKKFEFAIENYLSHHLGRNEIFYLFCLSNLTMNQYFIPHSTMLLICEWPFTKRGKREWRRIGIWEGGQVGRGKIKGRSIILPPPPCTMNFDYWTLQRVIILLYHSGAIK